MAEKHNTKKYPISKCQECSTSKAVIQKYGLMLCRRCFKDVALDLGFRKFD